MTPADMHHSVEPKPPRLQFSLLALFWLTTVFAILCSIATTIARACDYPMVRALAGAAYFFWPVIAVALATSCPDATRTVRRALFAGCGACVTVASAYGLCVGEHPRALLWFEVPIMLVFGLIVWPVESFVVLTVVEYCRKQWREGQCDNK